jgi:hypothetical protein
MTEINLEKMFLNRTATIVVSVGLVWWGAHGAENVVRAVSSDQLAETIDNTPAKPGRDFAQKK